MTDQERIAAFLATKGAKVIAPAPAYGVDPETDKARRAEARAQRESEESERRAEREMESVREAYHTGGWRGANEALGGSFPSRWRR